MPLFILSTTKQVLLFPISHLSLYNKGKAKYTGTSTMQKNTEIIGDNEYEENILKKSTGLRDHLLGYVSNTALVIWLLSYSFENSVLVMPFWQFLTGAFVGIFVWTLIEYGMHRGPYHHYPKATKVGHDLHHRYPKALIGIPYYVTLIAVISVFFILQFIFEKPGLGLIMGFMWLGYICYTLIHHASHQLSAKNMLFSNIRKHHLINHVHPDKNFGFLTTLWDRVFGTLYIPKKKQNSSS